MDEQERNAPVWLKLLVGFHVLATLVWAMPTSAPGVLNGRIAPHGLDWIPYANDRFLRVSPIQQYVLTLGFWQSWDMFAPNPSNRDVWGDAIIVYRSGRIGTFQYPRIYTESYPWKYVKERYRKYYERANLDQFAFMWEPFAQRIALLANDDPSDPPVRVTLRRHYILIPPTTPFSKYTADLWAGITQGRTTPELWLPKGPEIGEFETSVYATFEVNPK